MILPDENDLSGKTPPLEKSEEDFLFLVHEVHLKLLYVLDFEKVKQLREDSGLPALELYLREEIQKLIHKKKIAVPEEKKQKLTDLVIDEMLGFGPIEQLFKDETVSEILVNGPEKIFVERYGKIEKIPLRFIDEEHIYTLVQRIASRTGRHLDLATPYFDAQLPDGSRLHVIIPPVAVDGIKISIRKFQFNRLTLDHLVASNCLTAEMAQFLKIAVQARLNIVISGGTGSGKTTLLNSLLSCIGDEERVIIVEDVAELAPTHGHIVRLGTRAPNAEGKGAVTLDVLMINALRMRPDRIILGELRGAEAFNLLHAMNTGQDGSMVTLHASGIKEVMTRLLNLILMARYNLSMESVLQQIAGALDLIVYVSRLADGSRKVIAISQIIKLPDGAFKISDLFRFDMQGLSPEGTVKGVFKKLSQEPAFLEKLTMKGLKGEYDRIFS